jgi:hypothetical protein
MEKRGNAGSPDDDGKLEITVKERGCDRLPHFNINASIGARPGARHEATRQGARGLPAALPKEIGLRRGGGAKESRSPALFEGWRARNGCTVLRLMALT